MGYKFESLDTCVLARLVLHDDEEAVKKIYRYLEERPDRKFVIDDMAFSELVYLLEKLKGFAREDVVKSLMPFLTEYPFATNMLIDKILPFYEKHPKLSFNDCYLAFKAEESGDIPLWTLDQKLARQAEPAKLLS